MRTSSPFPNFFRNVYDSYTKLMMHFNGVDESTTFNDEIGKSINVNGDAQIDTAEKKFGVSSGLFDGTGDYLNISEHSDFDFSSSDFTIDTWIRFSDKDKQTQTIFSENDFRFGLIYNSASDNLLRIWISSYGVAWNTANGVAGTKSNWINNQWYHIALVYDGANYKVYVDGVQDISVSSIDHPYGNTGLYIGIFGNLDSGSYFQGHIDEFRVSKGIARWTSNFTPPTSQY